MPEVKPPKGKNQAWTIVLSPGETVVIESSDKPKE